MGLFKEKAPLKNEEIKNLYQPRRSFTEFMPITEYMPESGTFVFEDGVSRAAMFEITPIDVTAKPQEIIDEIKQGIESSLNGVQPADSPWMLQYYMSNEPVLDFEEKLIEYIKDQRWAKKLDEVDEFSKEWARIMGDHFEAMSAPEGAFTDPLSKKPWRAKERKIRLVIYRYRLDGDYDITADDEIAEVTDMVLDGMDAKGAKIKRMDEIDYLRWTTTWLNKTGLEKNEVIRQFDSEREDPEVDYSQIGDLSEMIFYDEPKTEGSINNGIWSINDAHHSVIRVAGNSKPGLFGRWSAQVTSIGGSATDKAILFDLLPEDTVLNVNVVCLTAQDNENIYKAHEVSEKKYDELRKATRQGNIFSSVSTLVYISGATKEQTIERRTRAISTLRTNAFAVNQLSEEIGTYKNFVKGLPCAYRPHYIDLRDGEIASPSRLMWNKDVVNILPIYGPYAGTGNPMITTVTAAGEPFLHDLIGDRVNNAHTTIVGLSGSGKSAQSVSLLSAAMAIHNPYLDILDYGDSFRIMGQWMRRHGKKVKHTLISPNAVPALPPLADAVKLFDQEEHYEKKFFEQRDSLYRVDFDDDEAEEAEERDLLGELTFAAKLMTGGAATAGGQGDPDRQIIKESIIQEGIWLAAEMTKHDGREQTMVDDLLRAMKQIDQKGVLPRLNIKLPKSGREMLFGIQATLGKYNSGILGQVCNRERTGELSDDDIDVNILDLGVAANKGSEDLLDIIVIGNLSRILTDLERRLGKGRQTVHFQDETHVTDTRYLPATYKRTGIKTWRKLGGWYWGATQQLDDGIPEVNIVRACENLIMLSIEDDLTQIDHLKKLRDVTAEQVEIFKSTTKRKPYYVEMALVSGAHKGSISRSILPSFMFAIAQTDEEERTERLEMMKKMSLKTELDASIEIAKRIDQQRIKSAREGGDRRY